MMTATQKTAPSRLMRDGWGTSKLLAVLAVLAALTGDSIAFAEDPIPRFSRQVLPLLADRCFHCHGPDPKHREADLRLDQEAAATAVVDGHGAINRQDPSKSELLVRIRSRDPDVMMPPPDSNRKPFTGPELELIEKWVRAGAVWGKHWSFESPQRPSVPTNVDAPQPIDAFVRARLRDWQLPPNPVASREVLIRRVTLDLTGLPPTPAEIKSFVDDSSPDAYEKVVARLLRSPHYGERMAWPWLDAARYADTGGYQGDPDRTMWPWRDWVVRALNENMPFDQFTIEQIAGDLLPNATPEQRLATGFNRNHMHNSEGGRIAEETRVENVFDRAETTATVWLGLTLQCARCHDHKFDPTSNDDYFAFFDFFNQTSESGKTDRSVAVPPSMDYVPDERSQQAEALKSQIEELNQQLASPSAEADEAQNAWERRARAETLPKWLDAISLTSKEGVTLRQRDDGAIHATGKLPEQDVYALQMTTAEHRIEALRLDALIDRESAAKGVGRDENGNFVLSEIEVDSRPRLAAGAEVSPDGAVWKPVKFQRATADYSQGAYAVERAIDGKVAPENGWGVSGHTIKKPRHAVFSFSQPLENKAGWDFRIRLRFESKHTHHLLALFRLTPMGNANTKTTIDDTIQGPLRISAEQRTPAQVEALRRHFRTHHWPAGKTTLKRIDVLEEELKQELAKSRPVKVMVMDTRPERRDTLVLVKGIYNDVTDRKIIADVPNMLPPLSVGKDHAPNRLDLARWIVNRRNPLTARVTVNRYWQMFFGRGIVATPDDFGLQGAQPTHPDLLDWLAVEFMESGWDVKHMHRLIVTSETYRQSAAVSQAQLRTDPDNLSLSRAPRFRMPSWMLRDQALAVSGLLAPVVGGPPVKPYQPSGIWAEATFGKKTYVADTGDKLHRRSLYTFWRRIVGPTMFFDAAKRQTCEVKSSRTNTPLHALTTLNDVTYVEAARMLAQKLLQGSESADARIRRAFVLLTSRQPEPREMQLLASRLKDLAMTFSNQPEQALQLVSNGASERDGSLDVAQLAAYTALCNLMLNLDEVLVKP